jgi:hypothetical protein
MSIALPPERKELGEPLVGNRLSAPAVWREALVIIRRHPVPTVAPALLLGALTQTPYLFPDSRSLLQGVLAFLTESFAFYLYVAYAEELSLEARRRRRFIPLPRVLRSLLVAAPAVSLVTVASLGALALPTAAASVLVIPGLWLLTRWCRAPGWILRRAGASGSLR